MTKEREMVEVTVEMPATLMEFLMYARKSGKIRTPLEKHLSRNLVAVTEAEIDAQLHDAKTK